jgi:SAM-dependent methyltransferase
MIAKYGYATFEEWVDFFNGRRRILDLGCGSGYSSSLWLATSRWQGSAMWVGLDISRAIETASERLGHIPNTHFVQADALKPPFPAASFDTVFSEGVLHHTPSTRAGIAAAARLLEPGGEFHFYVYRRKGPVREFTDDYVRDAIRELSEDQAWEAMRSLTGLGKALAELEAVIEIGDIPLLGIRAGTYDVQRLIYWHFAKVFWNSELSFEENVHINFDWYRPAYAYRHTEAELRAWCKEADLTIRWWHEQESGFTVIAVKH